MKKMAYQGEAASCRARTFVVVAGAGFLLCDASGPCSRPAVAVVVKRNDHLVSVPPCWFEGEEEPPHLLTVFPVEAGSVHSRTFLPPSACCRCQLEAVRAPRPLEAARQALPCPASPGPRVAFPGCLEEVWPPCLASPAVPLTTWRGGRDLLARSCSDSAPPGWRARALLADLAVVSSSSVASRSTEAPGPAQACRGRSRGGSRTGSLAGAVCSYWRTAAASCEETRGSRPACLAGRGTAVECSAVMKGTDPPQGAPLGNHLGSCPRRPSGRRDSRAFQPGRAFSGRDELRTSQQVRARPSAPHLHPSSAAAARTFHQDIRPAGRGNLRLLQLLPPPVLPSCRSPPVSLLQAGSQVAHRDLRSPEDSRGRGPGLVLDLQAGN